MHLSLVNPYIRVAMESKISSGHHISRRIIYDYEIIYLERGEFTFLYDNVPYHCTAGDIIFIRPGIPHSFHLDSSDISQPHIHFDITYRRQSETIPVSFKDRSQMTEAELGWIHKDYFSQYPTSPFLSIQNKSDFLKKFFRIVSHSESALIKKALLIELIAIIVNDNFRENVEDLVELRVEYQVKDYIDAGNGFGMALDAFSNMFFYDKFYLEKKFKATFGVGIIEYRNKKRMEFARELLKIYSVTKVSEILAYHSIYSFSRAYKKCYGYAPSKQDISR